MEASEVLNHLSPEGTHGNPVHFIGQNLSHGFIRSRHLPPQSPLLAFVVAEVCVSKKPPSASILEPHAGPCTPADAQ